MPTNPATVVQTAAVAGDTAASRFPVEELRRAMETRDYDGVLKLASDDFLFAPLGTDKIKFRGHERARAMLTALLTTADVFQYTGEMYSSHDTVVLPLRLTFGRLEVKAVDFLKIDEQGKMTDMVVYGRPYMPVTVLVGRVGLALVRQGGFLRWLPFRLFLWPLELSQRIAEPIGMWWGRAAMEKGLKRARRKTLRAS